MQLQLRPEALVKLLPSRVSSDCQKCSKFDDFSCFFLQIPVGGGHPQSDPVTVAAVVTQQLERHLSVRQDLALDLPPCLQLPDGEERPYGASTRLRIRDYDQVIRPSGR